MKQLARSVAALALLAFAAPAMPCGFEKTTTTMTTTPAPNGQAVRAEKAKVAKAQKGAKAKAPTVQRATATAAN